MKTITEFLLGNTIKLKKSEVEEHENDWFSPDHQKNTYADFITWFWKAIKYYGDFTDDEINIIHDCLNFYQKGRIALGLYNNSNYVYSKNNFVHKEITFKEGYDIVVEFLKYRKNIWY